MPAVLALPAFWGAVGAVGTGVGMAVAANESAGAMRDSANTQADAAGKAAQLKAASDAKALEFEREQAQSLWANTESTRQANYGQYSAAQGSQNQIRSAFGLPAIDIPAYVPTSNPGFTPTNGAPAKQAVPGTSADLSAPLLQALNSGQSGQGFIDGFNKQYGLPNGGSLAYYPDQNIYSIPSGYATKNPDGSWGWTARGGAGGANGSGSKPVTVPSIQQLLSAYAPQGNPLPPPLQPVRNVGGYL